jgi:hypothetical protein
MSALRFSLSFFSCLLLTGQLLFLSSQADAQTQKTAKSREAAKKTNVEKQCCQAGMPCPTPQTDKSPGCKCCGFRVDATLVKYNGLDKESTLSIPNTDTQIQFVVTDKNLDDKMKAVGDGKNGTFTLKMRLYKPHGHKYPSPSGFGTRYECLEVGNTSIPDRTQEYVQGFTVADSIYEVQEVLLNAIPKRDPDLDESKYPDKYPW